MDELIRMLLTQNPQLNTLMQQFSNPAVAKQKLIEMFNSGQIKAQDIESTKGFLKKFGLDNQVDSVLNELTSRPRKNSRW